jgi:hypothetical protein
LIEHLNDPRAAEEVVVEEVVVVEVEVAEGQEDHQQCHHCNQML